MIVNGFRHPMNLLTDSEQLGGGNWGQNGVVTVANQANDLAGANTLDMITYSGGFGNIAQTIPVTPNTIYTFSVEMKAGTNTEDYINIVDATNSVQLSSINYFSQLNTSTPIRVLVTFTTPGTCVLLNILLTTFNNSGTLFAGRSLLNKGGFVGRYITTTTVAIP